MAWQSHNAQGMVRAAWDHMVVLMIYRLELSPLSTPRRTHLARVPHIQSTRQFTLRSVVLNAITIDWTLTLPQVDESEVAVQERLAQRALNPTGFRPIDNIAPEVSYIEKVILSVLHSACQCNASRL